MANKIIQLKDKAGNLLFPKTQVSPGWNPISATLTYASATTINTNADLTGIIGKGDKIKLTQTTVKYFYVVAITSSLITVTAGSDYTVANATITLPYFSHAGSLFDFPDYFNWLPTITGVTKGNGNFMSQFKLIGKTVLFQIKLILGSTSAITGAVRISPPINGSDGLSCASNITLTDTGSAFYSGSAIYGGNTMEIYANYIPSGTYLKSNELSATVPFTWTTNDVIAFSGNYKI